MAKGILLFLCILFLSSLVYADGCIMSLTYDEYGVERDVLLSGEGSQVSVIDYRGGVEDMLISVKVTPEGDGMLWIFPIPSDPEKTEIDVVSEFPELEGYNIKNKLGGRIKEVEGWSLISQLWSTPFAFITNEDLIKREFFHAKKRSNYYEEGTIIALGIGDDLYLEEPDYGVKVYLSINKLGLTSELLTARHGEGLRRYLSDRNLTLPPQVVDEVDSYIGREYAFVVSWVSDLEKVSGERDLALRARFPTNRLFYPLKLTSVYGQQKVPMTVYFRGHVSPHMYTSIKGDSDVDYFKTTSSMVPSELDSFFDIGGGLDYTRVEINTESHNLKEDLWASTIPPLTVIFADFGLALPSPLFELLLFVFLSCTASFLAGWIIYGREVKPLNLVLLGFSNFTSFLGFSLASCKLLLKERKPPKHVILFFTPLFISLLSLIFLKFVDFGSGLLLRLISVLYLTLVIYFLSAASLTSFIFIREKMNQNRSSKIISLFFFLLLLPFIIPFVFFITFLPIYFIHAFSHSFVSTDVWESIGIFLYLAVGFILYAAAILFLLGILFSPIIIIYLLYSAVRRRIFELNGRVFYPGMVLNLVFVIFVLAKLLLDFMENRYHVNLFDILIYLVFLLPLALIYLASTTSLWYFILARKELTEQHRFFLFLVFFSILFAVLSFLSTEILMIEYTPL